MILRRGGCCNIKPALWETSTGRYINNRPRKRTNVQRAYLTRYNQYSTSIPDTVQSEFNASEKLLLACMSFLNVRRLPKFHAPRGIVLDERNAFLATHRHILIVCGAGSSWRVPPPVPRSLESGGWLPQLASGPQPCLDWNQTALPPARLIRLNSVCCASAGIFLYSGQPSY